MPDVAVAIVGDGPAGSALAQACRRRGVEVVLVGPDEPWTATYATWVDELDPSLVGTLGPTSDEVVVRARHERVLARPYGVFDNDRLRDHLRNDLDHRRTRVADWSPRGAAGAGATLRLDGGGAIEARLVIDCTGWPPRLSRTAPPAPVAWQTAFGVVLAEPPVGPLGRPTFMDFSDGGLEPPGARDASATFAYSLPVADGWLVEETVLAARAPVEPSSLLPGLARRLDRPPDELLAAARRTESVAIPMGTSAANPARPLRFGAAAGYVHPATGYSVTASLRAAPRVADAIADACRHGALLDDGAVDAIVEAVWPRTFRRARALHTYGLDVLLRLPPADVGTFFDVFFSQPTTRWSEYLRIDATGGDVARAMAGVFRTAPWSLRRRLMTSNPLPLARSLRP